MFCNKFAFGVTIVQARGSRPWVLAWLTLWPGGTDRAIRSGRGSLEFSAIMSKNFSASCISRPRECMYETTRAYEMRLHSQHSFTLLYTNSLSARIPPFLFAWQGMSLVWLRTPENPSIQWLNRSCSKPGRKEVLRRHAYASSATCLPYARVPFDHRPFNRQANWFWTLRGECQLRNGRFAWMCRFSSFRDCPGSSGTCLKESIFNDLCFYTTPVDG